MLTIFVSAKGIEQKTPDELTRWFLDVGYFSFTDGGYQTAEVATFTNSAGESFFSINFVIGVEDEPARIDGASILPWEILNECNRTAAKSGVNGDGSS